MLDLIIIGAGPAGLTAAIYAKRAGLDFIVIEEKGAGGQILSTYEVDNYPALPGISGMDLGMKMKEHADKFGVKFVTESVASIENNGDYKTVVTDKSRLEAKNIVVATGARYALLGIDKEQELTGMGVSYCATCDGAFYKGADVAVVGGGDVAVEDALYLARNCNKVYLIHRRDELRAATVLAEKAMNTPNIEIVWNHTVSQILGEDEVEGIMITDVNTKEEEQLDVEGIFIAVGINPATKLLEGLVDMDEKGYVIAGEDCKTSCPGIYVAGDIRKKNLRQVVTAVADGANCINSIV